MTIVAQEWTDRDCLWRTGSADRHVALSDRSALLYWKHQLFSISPLGKVYVQVLRRNAIFLSSRLLQCTAVESQLVLTYERDANGSLITDLWIEAFSLGQTSVCRLLSIVLYSNRLFIVLILVQQYQQLKRELRYCRFDRYEHKRKNIIYYYLPRTPNWKLLTESLYELINGEAFGKRISLYLLAVVQVFTSRDNRKLPFEFSHEGTALILRL